MTVRTATLFMTLVIFCTTSCTVQKRVHRKGWFVQWNLNKKDSEEIARDKDQTSGTIARANESIQNENQSQPNGNDDSDFLDYEEITAESWREKNLEIKALKEPSLDTSKSSKHIPNYAQIIPIATAFSAVISSVFVLVHLGFAPILIPIFITFLIALITLVTIRYDWSVNSPDVATKLTRRNLLWMTSFIVVVFGISILIIFSNIPSIYVIVLVAILLLVASILTSNFQKKDKEHLEKENSEPNDVPKNITESENEFNVPHRIVVPRRNEIFPGRVAGFIVCLILGIIVSLILLLIIYVSSWTGLILGPMFITGVIVAGFLFAFALGMFISLERNYNRYLEDLVQETYPSETLDREESKKNENGSLILALVAAFAVIAIAITLLLY